MNKNIFMGPRFKHHVARAIISSVTWHVGEVTQVEMRGKRYYVADVIDENDNSICIESPEFVARPSDPNFEIRQPTLTVQSMSDMNVLVVPEVDIEASKKELRKMYEQGDTVKKQNRSGWRRK